jgi:hypothetical protein
MLTMTKVWKTHKIEFSHHFYRAGCISLAMTQIVNKSLLNFRAFFNGPIKTLFLNNFKQPRESGFLKSRKQFNFVLKFCAFLTEFSASNQNAALTFFTSFSSESNQSVAFSKQLQS